jgi:hypothetical protein
VLSSHPHPPLDALHFLRRHVSGVLVADDAIYPRRFVLDPSSGLPVLALPLGVEEAESIVLHVPDEGEPSLQLLAELRWLDPHAPADGAASDRFLIYHGKGEDSRLATLSIVDAKWTIGVALAEDVAVPNPVAGDEPRLCKQLNADRARLAALVLEHAGRDVAEPLAVGVDPDGMDVRTRTGLVRVEFIERATPAAVRATIEAWTS